MKPKVPASRTRGALAVQLPAGEPPRAPIWSKPGGSSGKADRRRGAESIGFRMLRVAINAIAGADAVLALPGGNLPVVFLAIRNASNSVGSLLVSFGGQPSSIANCDFELVPGALLMLDGSSGVPQDDVWVFSTDGANGSISYGVRK